MAGYLGTKAAFLSTTTASVGGNSTIGGDLTVDTNTLYVDSTNNRVGIGNTSPTQALDVTGDIVTSGGVYLGGTGAANKLTDYEEGSFSPMTSTEADVYHARYTKIGNLVTINCALKMKSGQNVDSIALPFTPLNDGVGKNTATNNATDNRYAGAVSFFEVSTSVINLMLFHQGNQGARAFFIAQTGSQVWPKGLTDAEFGTVAISFTYQTS